MPLFMKEREKFKYGSMLKTALTTTAVGAVALAMLVNPNKNKLEEKLIAPIPMPQEIIPIPESPIVPEQTPQNTPLLAYEEKTQSKKPVYEIPKPLPQEKLPQLLLTRNTYSDKSTIGELTLDSNRNGLRDNGEEHLAYTLELPKRNNKRKISSIPTGEYRATPRISKKFKKHFLVEDVPHRSYILFHSGNYPRDTEGCILVGKTKEKDSVGNSRPTLKELRKKFPKGFKVRIRRS